MPALICGSLAYDTIMVFQDQFKNHILPDKVHILNVAFLVPRMRKEFGGCAGNISYNLKLLGGHPIPMGTVGQDFAPYRAHFEKCGIDLSQIKVLDDLYTAQAFITTDLDDNQITAFHPGAMMRSHENHVRDVPGIKFGIVGPDGRDAMLQHAAEFAEKNIPFIFDPGQAMPLFNGEEFRAFIEQAQYVTVNDYESNLLQRNTGWNEKQIAERVQAYIVTRGPKGSLIHTTERTYDIAPAQHLITGLNLQRGAGVDALDVGMGVRRAQDRGVELIRQLEVVEVAAAPHQQARVLAPPHRLTDRELTHERLRLLPAAV